VHRPNDDASLLRTSAAHDLVTTTVSTPASGSGLRESSHLEHAVGRDLLGDLSDVAPQHEVAVA
jgi:hypothetical protein